MSSDNTPSAGWFPDPAGSDNDRYWDGIGWTDELRPTTTHGEGSGSTPDADAVDIDLGATAFATLAPPASESVRAAGAPPASGIDDLFPPPAPTARLEAPSSAPVRAAPAPYGAPPPAGYPGTAATLPYGAPPRGGPAYGAPSYPGPAYGAAPAPYGAAPVGYGAPAYGGYGAPTGAWRGPIDNRPHVTGPLSAVRTVFGKYAEFDGRASQAEFWYFVLAWVMAYTTLFVAFVLAPLGALLIGGVWLAAIAAFVPTLAVTIRRMRDAGWAWPWIFFGFVPLAGPIMLIIICASPSRHP